MEKDFIRELGYRALDNRLKRISDKMYHDTRKFFKQVDLDAEPGWHLIFKLLQEKQELTMVEIAEYLGYSHPSTVVILKKMTARGYITSQTDKEDKRKRNIKLTEKSIALLPQLQEIWKCCEQAIYEMLEEDLTIITYLDKIETSLKNIPLHERFRAEYRKELKN